MSFHSPKIKRSFDPLGKENPKLPVEVTAALIKQDGKYLVTQRLPGEHLGLYWEFPGGKREPGESLESCLIREISEELDLKIAVNSLVKKLSYEYPNRKIILYFYQCHILEGDPVKKDCHDFKWVSPCEMDEGVFPPADISIIRLLKGVV